MNILFKTNRLRKTCESIAEAKIAYGSDQAYRLILRITQLQAADDLEDIGRLPQVRLHRLKGSRKNQFAIDLIHPYRLVFGPVNEFDINDHRSIKSIRILEVKDYH